MLLEILILLLAIPTGYIIAYLTPDELIQGRKWFKIIIVASIATAIFTYITGYNYITLTTIFMAIVSFISYVKSFDKKFTK